MARSTILAAGLSIFVGVSILVLLAELYYLRCWRRRVLLANPRVSQEISPVHVVEDAVSSGQTTCPSNNLDVIIVGYQEDLELVKKKIFPNVPTAAAPVKVTTDLDTSLKSMSQVSSLSINPDMSRPQLNTLMDRGQPHMLFTIKEEEDLEPGVPAHPKKKKSKWKAIISKSMESAMLSIVGAPDTSAFVTTSSPPHHNTPTSCSLSRHIAYQ